MWPRTFSCVCIRHAEFYRDVLGFTFDEFFGEPPSFTIVKRDHVRIMFRQPRPAKPAVARPNRSVMDETFDAYIYLSDVDKLATELRAKKADIIEGPVNRIYRMRELLVRIEMMMRERAGLPRPTLGRVTHPQD